LGWYEGVQYYVLVARLNKVGERVAFNVLDEKRYMWLCVRLVKVGREEGPGEKVNQHRRRSTLYDMNGNNILAISRRHLSRNS